MNIDPDKERALQEFADHPREWGDNLYVYPVISRRSAGLSIGINLSPDTACDFNCVYCQVERSAPPEAEAIDLTRLREELGRMLSWAADGSIFSRTPFGHLPARLRRVNDIAFSGDGEPTTCPVFAEAVALAAELKAAFGLSEVKIVLITNSCHLATPTVARALQIMDVHNGEIWAKLDAGTQETFERINRCNFPLTHVMENIIAAARVRPICIQSLFMNIQGQAPSSDELAAYIDRLKEVVAAGGMIKKVQVYTVARRPAEAFVTPLSAAQLRAISERVQRQTGLPTQAYHSG